MKTFALSLLFTALFLTSSYANANQNLNFQQPDSEKEKRVVGTLKDLQNTPDAKYSIASVDLNGDSLDEYVLRSERCEEEKLCSYVIIGLQDHRPMILGEFKAHKLLISNKKIYGIKHIHVFNNLNNDYKSTIAFWDPFSFRFKIQAEQ